MATPEDARRANRSLLLRSLHHGGPVSRADLAKLTGLTPATVRPSCATSWTTPWSRSSVEHSGASASRRRSSASRPTAGTSCRQPVRAARFVGALVNLAGKVVLRRTYERKDRTGTRRRRAVRRICDDLVADAERPLLGIGVASPGIVDPDGVVLTAARLGWTGVPLAADLAADSALPVEVVNDANASALAELTFGAAHGPLPHLRPRRRRRRRRARARRARCSPARRTPPARSATSSSIPTARLRLWQAGLPGDRGLGAAARRRLEADAGDGTAVLARAGEHLGTALATVLSALDVADVVLSGSGAGRHRHVPRRRGRRRSPPARCPCSATASSCGPATFGFDDVLVGAAARARPRARHPMSAHHRSCRGARSPPAHRTVTTAPDQSRGGHREKDTNRADRWRSGRRQHASSPPAATTTTTTRRRRHAGRPTPAEATDAPATGGTDAGRGDRRRRGRDHPPLAQRHRHPDEVVDYAIAEFNKLHPDVRSSSSASSGPASSRS